MRDGHGRAEQVAAGPDRLAHRLAPMEHHLEVEVRDGGAGRADVIAGGDGPCSSVHEPPVHLAELREDPVTLAIEASRRRGREDGIALELDHGEIRLHAFDDGVQEVTEHRVGAGFLVVEVEEKSTGQFMVGAGFSSVDNLLGFMELSQGNFDIIGHRQNYTAVMIENIETEA